MSDEELNTEQQDDMFEADTATADVEAQNESVAEDQSVEKPKPNGYEKRISTLVHRERQLWKLLGSNTYSERTARPPSRGSILHGTGAQYSSHHHQRVKGQDCNTFFERQGRCLQLFLQRLPPATRPSFPPGKRCVWPPSRAHRRWGWEMR